MIFAHHARKWLQLLATSYSSDALAATKYYNQPLTQPWTQPLCQRVLLSSQRYGPSYTRVASYEYEFVTSTHRSLVYVPAVASLCCTALFDQHQPWDSAAVSSSAVIAPKVRPRVYSYEFVYMYKPAASFVCVPASFSLCALVSAT